jgi:cystathionine beta-lyase
MKFNTKTIHGGQHNDPTTGGRLKQFFKLYICTNQPGKPIGDYVYSRSANPTRTALEGVTG